MKSKHKRIYGKIILTLFDPKGPSRHLARKNQHDSKNIDFIGMSLRDFFVLSNHVFQAQLHFLNFFDLQL